MSKGLPSLVPFALLALIAACSSGNDDDGPAPPAEAPDPAEILAGERLFLEDRFAQFFAANAAGNLNLPLASGDPALDFITLDGVQRQSPFAGSTFSCAVCHNVDQALDLPGGGMRSYNDFASRSPVTARADGMTTTVRNSPPLVNASIVRVLPTQFHFDGEFTTLADLVVDTLEGRNYGWLPSEQAAAEAHVAAVIRQDDGAGALAADFGAVPYSQLLDSNATGVPAEFDLPAQFKIDLGAATDAEIVDAVAALIAEYTQGLAFARDDADVYSASPYDAFLVKNGLPQAPDVGEAALDYARRLLTEIDALASPKFVAKGSFAFHDQDFAFGALELQGLRVFLRETSPALIGGAGNCASCHTPPDFTDFGLHNVGFTQDEHDAVHGPGAFLALTVPDLATRDADPDAYLPATSAHPNAAGPFRASIDPLDPTRTDLGLWNVFANDDFALAQASLLDHLDHTFGAGTSALGEAALLALTEGLFKTPGLRDLSHSAPYGHAGTFATLEDVVNHYLEFGPLANDGFVRNADARLADVDLIFGDIAPLAAFLRSLNEDYE